MALMWRPDGSGPIDVGGPKQATRIASGWTFEEPKSKVQEPAKKESKKSSFKKE